MLGSPSLSLAIRSFSSDESLVLLLLFLMKGFDSATELGAMHRRPFLLCSASDTALAAAWFGSRGFPLPVAQSELEHPS